MGKIKDLQLLESMLFDSIEYLERTLKVATPGDSLVKIRYQSGLAALDLLNYEYHEITGKYFIEIEKVLQYHANQWSKF